ncbi:MAG: hypothetical protein ABL983_06595, partial [Nitrospira sp.]
GGHWNYRRVFELSRGKYFRRAPADDLFAPESLAECVTTLDADQGAVVCYLKMLLINAAREVSGTYKDEVMHQMAYIREWRGQFIVPIPEVTIVT